ncbi:MAG: TVP38/TMEM64 family protein [Betaproteobacteria bacterium]|nr:TVP38/TMEM64 family protein [Betaproteobacteria bacterium]
MSRGRWALIALLAVGVGLFFGLGLHRRLALSELHLQQAALSDWVAARPVAASLGFLAACVAMAAFSLPGTLVLPLLGGAIFGPPWAVLLAALGLSAGAVLSFLSARYLLRGVLLRFWGHRLARIDHGLAREGAFLYLLSLRLVPVLPFFVVNLLLGLTGVRTRVFYLTTLIGMLPAMVVLAGVGDRLTQFESVQDALSPQALLGLCALALLVVAARRAWPRLARALRARARSGGA